MVDAQRVQNRRVQIMDMHLVHSGAQAELIRGCPQAAAPVAMAIYLGIFNVGIASGTWLGGHFVSRDLLSYIGFAGAVLAVGATLVALCFYVPKIKAGSGQP